MNLFRCLVIAFFIAMWPNVLYSETTEVHKELSVQNAVETLQQDFRWSPVWRTGAVQVNAKPQPLSDPLFSWAAGYLWSHPPIGVVDRWPQPTKNFPAWTSNGGADAAP